MFADKKNFIIILTFVIVIGIVFYFGYLKISNSPNVILITIDALRPDHLGCYGYRRNTSPNIDKLAKEGVIFTQAIAQSSHTAPSIISLITSTHPNIHNVKDWGYQLNPCTRIYMLTEILKSHGYITTLISDQLALSLIKDLKRGFDTYNTIWTYAFGPKNKQTKIIEITDWAIDWLKNNRHKRFFLWLYYLDPHGPYTPPPPYNKIFLNDEHYNINKRIPISDDVNVYNQFAIDSIPKYLAIDDISEVDYYISQYDGEIRYVDTQIGRLYEELKKLNLDKNTLIIITSDHGEAMGEHHLYFCHSTFLYDELIKVPLIIKFNKTIPFSKKIDIQVRSIDILPTIMDILALDIKEYKTIQGISLLPLILSQKYNFPIFAYSEFLNRKSIRTNEWKLIYNEDDKQFELYNLKDDPRELNNLVSVEKEKFESLKQKLNEYLKQSQCQNREIKSILDEETKEKLKSLGYAQ